MDPRPPTILPPVSLPLVEAVLLLAYLSVQNLLQMQPDQLQFVNPVILLELTRIGLLVRSPELLQAVHAGFMDTGGFAACPELEENILPTMESILQSYNVLLNTTNSE
jgi:hypothetical protein